MPGVGALGNEIVKALVCLKNCVNKSKPDKGNIYLCDFDMIELSNLNRQFLYTEKHINKSKAIVAKSRVQEKNPYLNVEAFDLKLDA